MITVALLSSLPLYNQSINFKNSCTEISFKKIEIFSHELRSSYINSTCCIDLLKKNPLISSNTSISTFSDYLNFERIDDINNFSFNFDIYMNMPIKETIRRKVTIKTVEKHIPKSMI